MKKILIIMSLLFLLALTGCKIVDNTESTVKSTTDITLPSYQNSLDITTDVVDGYLEGSNKITFAKGGTYTLKGTFNGSLVFASSLQEAVTLILNEAYLYNDSMEVISWQSDVSKIEIKAQNDTVNKIEVLHNNKYEVNAINSENNVELGGKGTLIIVGAQKHAVKGSNIVVKGNVTLDITAEKDGLHGKQITFNGGNTTIHDCNDAMEANINSKGNKGTIAITNGTIKIDNCITAFKAEMSLKIIERALTATEEAGVINIKITKTEVTIDSPETDISSTVTFTVDGAKYN